MSARATKEAHRFAIPANGGEAPRWFLHCMCSPDARLVGTRIEVIGALVLGRAPDAPADVLGFHDGAISGRHLAIGADAEAVVVNDLNSRNGTWIDGVRRSSAICEPGTVIRLGETVLVTDRRSGSGDIDDEPWDEVPGHSHAACTIRARIRSAASDGRPTLVCGPTGAGKEFAARAIHRLSARSGPLVCRNVTEVPDNLLESELFGHTRGAFSGAAAARLGCLRQADKGTLLLDEIGDLPLALQPKLLRPLEEARIRPVGSDAEVRIDVKFVAATNVDLDAAVASGRFRQDLAARLRAHRVDLPPIRERRADLLALAEAVVPANVPTANVASANVASANAAARGANGDGPSWGALLSADAVEALVLFDWPDNLRGLSRVLEALRSGSHRPPYAASDLPPELAAHVDRLRRAAGGGSAGEAAAQPKPLVAPAQIPSGELPSQEALVEAIAVCGGNMQAVARTFGRDRRQVYRWLRRYGIDIDDVDRLRRRDEDVTEGSEESEESEGSVASGADGDIAGGGGMDERA